MATKMLSFAVQKPAPNNFWGTVWNHLMYQFCFMFHWLNRPERYAAGTHSGQTHFYRAFGGWSLTWKYIYQTRGRFVAIVDVVVFGKQWNSSVIFHGKFGEKLLFCVSVSTASLRLQWRNGFVHRVCTIFYVDLYTLSHSIYQRHCATV